VDPIRKVESLCIAQEQTKTRLQPGRSAGIPTRQKTNEESYSDTSLFQVATGVSLSLAPEREGDGMNR
jgi:hypothetical protein